MPLPDDLLNPIPGANPGGAEVRYDPIFDKIKEARREDDDVPQGEWQTARKTADWPLVIKLASDVLTNKSKDLQVAAWLSEALLRREGFVGFRNGLAVLHGLLDAHWDHLYPEIEDGDAEMRAAPLDWVGSKLDVAVRLSPIDRTGHNLLQVRDARFVPRESEVAENYEKGPVREAAIAEGKTTPEEVEDGFAATPKAWYRALVTDVQGSIDTLKALDEISSEKFGDVAPNFGRLSDALEEVLRSASQQLKRKLEIDPDPVEAAAPDANVASDLGAGDGAAAAASGVPRALAAEPVSAEDAASRIVGAARYLRRASPYSPAAYLMLRGFRWGELRASRPLDPKLLEAPATNVRTNLKGLLLDAKWPELLEAAETVLGTPQGRGWLDLQRYAVTACESLGTEYDAVVSAMKGALRSLLADCPGLLDMTLMDDTPTANVETRVWLRDIMHTAPSPEQAGADESAAPVYEDAEPRSRDPIALANAEVRAGRAERAIGLLMREASREKTRRGRFLLQSQLARIMVEAGHHPVAMPILEELIADVESYKLEEWETGELVAVPLALLYKCIERLDGDATVKQSLYLRICRLDPVQAISFSQP